MLPTPPVPIGKVLDLNAGTLQNGTYVYGNVVNGAIRELTLQVEPTFPGGASDITVVVEAKYPGGTGYVPVLTVRQGANAEQASHVFAAATDGKDSLITPNLAHAVSWRVGAKSNGAVAASTAIQAYATGSAF